MAQCLARRDAFKAGDEITVEQADIRTAAMENASMAVLNFTLQFLPPDQRGALMQRIARAMRPGGVLVISEKLVFDDDAVNDLFIDLHHQYKRSQGYSDLEIAQKRAAIEKVLVPDTLSTHKKRLAEAGFSRSEVWFQCFNFASILAIK